MNSKTTKISSVARASISSNSSNARRGEGLSRKSSSASTASNTSAVSGSSRFSVEIPDNRLLGTEAHFYNEDGGLYDCRNAYCRWITGVRLVENRRGLEIVSSGEAFHSKLFSNAKDQKVLMSLANKLRQAGTQQDVSDAAVDAFQKEYPTFLEDRNCLLQYKPKMLEYGCGAGKGVEPSRPAIDRTITGTIPFTQAHGAHYRKKVVKITSVRDNKRELRDCIPFFQIVIVCENGREYENYDFFDKKDRMRLHHLAKTQHGNYGSEMARMQAIEQFKSRYAVEYNDKGYLRLVKR